MRSSILVMFLAASVAGPVSASAEPLTFTWTSTLSAPGGGSDVLGIGGANLIIQGLFDSAPTLTTPSSDFINELYTFNSINASFTNRPGGAPDVTLPMTAFLNVVNMIDSSSCGALCDRVAFGGSTVGTLGATLSGSLIRVASAEQFAVGAPPIFDYHVGNGSVNATFLNTSSGAYGLSISGISVNRVPEPATMTLLGLGVAGLGLARRRYRLRKGSNV